MEHFQNSIVLISELNSNRILRALNWSSGLLTAVNAFLQILDVFVPIS